MSAYDELKAGLAAAPRTWLVTGAAGFIFAAILVSIAALYGGLRLYNDHFREPGPVLRQRTRSEEK